MRRVRTLTKDSGTIQIFIDPETIAGPFRPLYGVILMAVYGAFKQAKRVDLAFILSGIHSFKTLAPEIN